MRKQRHVLEEYLVLCVQAGDRNAVRQLVELRGPRLVPHAAWLLGNLDDASDVVQDGWIEILRGLKGLREPRAFAVWATRIITRCTKNQIKRRELGEALWSEGQIMPSDPKHLDGAEMRMVRGAIAALPAAQSAAITLFYLEEMSVAAALNIPRSTVKTRLLYAREALKHVLERSEL